MTWLPEATAPRDGTLILGFDPELHGCWPVRWDNGGWYVSADSSDGMGYPNTPITHWQPLPEPPTLRRG